MLLRWMWVCTLLAASWPPGIARAQEVLPVCDDYVLRTWEVDDGLPTNNIASIAQTTDGYLWLASWSGLVRFDGERFTTFHSTDTPGLESDHVRTVLGARDGSLWVGMDRGGVARRRAGRFEIISPLLPEQANPSWIESFAEDTDSSVWWGHAATGQTTRFAKGKLTVISAKDGLGTRGNTSIFVEPGGKRWVSTREACGYSDGSRFHRVDDAGGEAITMAVSKDGGTWATRDGGLMRYEADDRVTKVADLPWPRGAGGVVVLCEDHSGALWIGTRDLGLIRYWNGEFVRVPVSHTSISAITEDREQNLWVATRGGGISRLRPKRFSLYERKNGLVNDTTTTLCQDSEGRIWMAGADGVPVRGTDSTNREFAVPPGLPGVAIFTLCANPEGGVWLGSAKGGGGLIQWRDGLFSKNIVTESLTSLLVDRQGDLWAAIINKGVFRYRDGEVTTLPTGDGLVRARALAEDGAGRIWFGTEDGLVFYHQNAVVTPVPLPSKNPNEAIRFLVADERDTVWIGALGGGLYRWRGGGITRLEADSRLPTNDLRLLLIDPAGKFWFGTERGLFAVARQGLDAALDEGKPLAGVVAYGRSDGLPGLEFSYGFRNATLRARDGHLWLATLRGALEVHANDEFANPVAAPPVVIEEARLGNQVLDISRGGGLELPPEPGPLQLRYTLPQLSAPEKIDFRYRLVGSADDWIFAEGQRSALFPHLPAGDYRFEVAAAEAGQPWTSAVASLEITVRAAWWESPWVRTGEVLLGGLALTGLIRWIIRRRVRARIRRIKQDHALELERTRIARDIHDEVGSSLTQIAIASKLARYDSPESVQERVQQISAIARRTAESVDEIVWAINPRNDTLTSLLEYLGQHALDFLTSAGISCELDIPAELPTVTLTARTRHHLFLAVKESLHNIVKHSGADTVTLAAECAAGALRVVVSDNGRGFATPSDRAAGADGLDNMRHRMTESGGNFRFESSPEMGTRMIFEVPWPE